MDIYWPKNTLLVSNVAREAKRVAHPCYRAFHGFGLAKFPDSDSILGLNQITLLPQLPSKRCLI